MLRVGVFALCAADAVVVRGPLANAPGQAFEALGFMALIPEAIVAFLLSPVGFGLLRGFTIATSLAAAAGVHARITMGLATASFIAVQAIPRGIHGYITHPQLPLMLAALVLSLFPADEALRLWPRAPLRRETRDPRAVPLMIAVLICLGYVWIAAHRIAFGGLALFTSDSLSAWILRWNLPLPELDQQLGMRVIRSPLLASLAKWSFPLITLLELSAPLALVSRRFRQGFVPAMLSVHLGIFLLMHQSFSHLALLYIVFIDASRWSPRTLAPGSTGTVLFDGYCGLCNRFVDFLLRHDRGRRLRMAPLSGTTATRLAPGRAGGAPDSVVYVVGGRVLARSDAAIAALSQLGGLWSFVAVLGLVPRWLRDRIYDMVAVRRYRWFGQRDSCRLPGPGEQAWFLP